MRRLRLHFCAPALGGEPAPVNQFSILSKKYLLEFITEHPPDFPISAGCCAYCKKKPAHKAQEGYDMVITGERASEGGQRMTVPSYNSEGGLCFQQQTNGQFRLRPLYYVTMEDKEWYKGHYGIKYSDAYEVYGLKRTGCCGCPISYRVISDLELIRPYEPNVVNAAWNIFGKSYEYREQYNEYRKARMRKEKQGAAMMP